MVEAVKLADDGSGDVVRAGLRGARRPGHRDAHAVVPGPGAVETDLLERDLEPDALGEGLALRLRPFQIATIRLRR